MVGLIFGISVDSMMQATDASGWRSAVCGEWDPTALRPMSGV
jgi:hypothetical protein